MVNFKKKYLSSSLKVLSKRVEKIKCIGSRKLFMGLNKLHELGIARLKHILQKNTLIDAPANTPYSLKGFMVIF